MTAIETPEDKAYYERRAREERERAVTCADNAAALAHLNLAREYERRLHPRPRVAAAGGQTL